MDRTGDTPQGATSSGGTPCRSPDRPGRESARQRNGRARPGRRSSRTRLAPTGRETEDEHRDDDGNGADARLVEAHNTRVNDRYKARGEMRAVLKGFIEPRLQGAADALEGGTTYPDVARERIRSCLERIDAECARLDAEEKRERADHDGQRPPGDAGAP